MNSKQLRWILSNDKVTSRNFKGVYALDEIKHIQQISFSSAYIFNLDPSYKPGVHWVAVYTDRKGRVFKLAVIEKLVHMLLVPALIKISYKVCVQS